jgi:uncharacterized protein (TIGR02001 family)
VRRLLAVGSLWLATVPVIAGAQVSGRVTWLTDDRFRGMSLSDQHPAVQASINVDHESGGYVGALLSLATPSAGKSPQNLRLYAGYAQAIEAQGMSWDVGVVTYRFGHEEEPTSSAYTEWFAGLSGESWNARLYGSADYLGQGTPSAYLELNALRPLTARLTLTGHVGWQRWLGKPGEALPLDRWDARCGLDMLLTPLNVGLAVVDAWPRQGLCYPGQARCSASAVLSVSAKF